MRIYVLAVASLLSASAASAADFTGPWVDVRGGWDSVQLKASGNGVSVSESRSGVLYGGAAGYDVALGAKAIAGLQLGAYGSTAKECTEVFGNDEACIKVGRDLEVLARLGFKAGADTLVYALAGYANGRAAATYIDFDDFANSGSLAANEDGWRAGAGVEQAYGKVFAKFEYRYTSYSKADLGFGADAGFNRHQLLIGAGYRF